MNVVREVRLLEATATAPKAGQFVEWAASKGTAKGRVISVHTAKVPGVISAKTASTEAPAARVQLYAKSGNGWEPTTTYIGQDVTMLSSIAALPENATEATVVAGSFDEIRCKVRDAIRERIAGLAGVEDISVYVMDIGMAWAVYEVNYGDDLYLVEYSVDAAGLVAIGEPVEVYRKVTYEAAVEAEQQTDTVEGRLLGAVGTDAVTGSRIFAVQLIAYGDSINGRRYPEAVMRAAAPKYEGAKAFDRHRTLAELNSSTIQGLVGHYRNVEATSVGLQAELHLLPSATHIAEALDASLANQAEGLPPLVGISHDVQTMSRPIQANGRSLTECVSVIKVNSADVVADPSAGGVATRMVAGGTSTATPIPNKENSPMLTLKQLIALLRTTEAAGRAALLEAHASTLTEAGLTGDDALRITEAAETPAPPAPVATTQRSTEAAPATYPKASLTSRVIINTALEDAKLDGARFREAVVAELPDHFTEAELLAIVARSARMVEAAGLAPSVQHVTVGKDERDRQVEALDLMLDTSKSGGFRSLKEAYSAFTGRPEPRDHQGYTELFRECISVNNGGIRTPFDSGVRSTESITVASFGQIFGDSIWRRAIAEYSRPSLQTWKKVVSQYFNLSDFRTQRIVAMGGYGTLPTVAEGAPYQALTTPADEEATYSASKKGGTEDLTMEAIRNDDLRAMQAIPRKLGLAAAQTLYRHVWDLVITNPTLTRDSVALFDAAHANTTATNLSSTALETSRIKMRKQSGYGDTSDILSLVPKLLLVTPENEALAFELCTSAVAIPSGAPVGAASSTPNLHQGMDFEVIDYWSATSTTFWALVADPTMAPTIELGFLDGKEEPDIFVQSDETTGSMFTSDKATYKVRHIYGSALLDYRSFQRGQS